MFNILVAEDDASACRLMCEVLRQAGYQPFPAGDGAQALALMEHRHIDLAVVDLTMPQMDGLTFTRTVREGGSSLPILMVTARVAQAEAALSRAVAAGVQVRVASRCPQGRMLALDGAPWRDAGGLSPVKARVSLLLELMQGA